MLRWNVFLAGAKDPSKEISNENLIVHKRFSSVNIERQGGVYLAVYTGSFDDNEVIIFHNIISRITIFAADPNRR